MRIIATPLSGAQGISSSAPCSVQLGLSWTRGALPRFARRLVQKGEIIDGELYVQPRPRAGHARALGTIVSELQGPYDLARNGPGGWWILPEPGIELPGSPEFSPAVAG